MGINYNPCVISTSARGADATAAGVNIQPNVRTVDTAPQLAWSFPYALSPLHACLRALRACYLRARPLRQGPWLRIVYSSKCLVTVYTGDRDYCGGRIRCVQANHVLHLLMCCCSSDVYLIIPAVHHVTCVALLSVE